MTEQTNTEGVEKELADVERLLKRGFESKRPITQGDLNNTIVNTLLPLFRALRVEYNEGFDAVAEQLDSAEGGDVAVDVLEKGRETVGTLVIFAQMLLRQLDWTDEQDIPTAKMPATMAEAYSKVSTLVAEFSTEVDAALAEADDEDDDGDDEGDGEVVEQGGAA